MNGPKPTRQLVEEWLAANSGRPVPSASEVARQIGRPKTFSYVAKLLRAMAPVAPAKRADRETYAERGETRRRVQEYLDAHPGVELSNVEMARTLGLKEKTVGQAMRQIIRERDNGLAEAKTARAQGARPKDTAQVATRRPAPVTPPANGLMAVIQATFGSVTVPSDVLVRVPGTNTRHGDGVVRDVNGRLYELREM